MKGGSVCSRFQFARKAHSQLPFVRRALKSHSPVSASRPSAIPFLQMPEGCVNAMFTCHSFPRLQTAPAGMSVFPRLGLERDRCIRVVRPRWIPYRPQPSLHSKPARVPQSVANTTSARKNTQDTCIHAIHSENRSSSGQMVSFRLGVSLCSLLLPRSLISLKSILIPPTVERLLSLHQDVRLIYCRPHIRMMGSDVLLSVLSAVRRRTQFAEEQLPRVCVRLLHNSHKQRDGDATSLNIIRKFSYKRICI